MLPTRVVVCSGSPLKKESTEQALSNCGLGTCAVETAASPSGVPEQPVGRDQIRQGATRRLDVSQTNPFRLSVESGVVTFPDGRLEEVSCVLYRTPLGVYEEWTAPFVVGADLALAWLEQQKADGSVTLGHVAAQKDGADPKDWYPAEVGSRVEVLRAAAERAVRRHLADAAQVPALPAPLVDHKNVAFLDVGEPLATRPRAFLDALPRLLRGVAFNKLVGAQSRGFLGLAELARQFPGVEAVMARTAGKLPGNSLVGTGDYSKEYKDGDDTVAKVVRQKIAATEHTLNRLLRARGVAHKEILCDGLESKLGELEEISAAIDRAATPCGLFVQRDRFQPGDRVVLYDDLGATWGTLKALVDMFHREFEDVRVVALVTPYVVVDDEGRLLGPPATRGRTARPPPAALAPTPSPSRPTTRRTCT